jgi:glycosyltransferase involved in cell wall biosynthesis
MEADGRGSLRVLRVITRLNIGGPAIQAIRLSTTLKAAGCDTLLVYGRLGPGEGDMRYLLTDAGVTTEYLDTLQRPIAPLADLRAALALYRAICRIRPHVVHTHMAKAGLLARTAAVLYNWTHPSARTRIVHTYHGHVLDGYFSPLKTRLFIALERLLARGSDTLIAISPRVRDELVDRYRIGSRGQFVLIPLGLELDAFGRITPDDRTQARRALGIAEDALVMTTVGRLTAIKQQTLFLDMAQRIAARFPTAVFLIVGDGELRADLEADARARGLADRVRFLGWRRDLATIYGATDVFTITSRNEGTPVALIEAMASGVPGVSTDVGGVRDVIVDGSVGIVVPPDDAAALAEAVDGLLSNPERRAEMSARARMSSLSRFQFDRLTADIADLYRRLTA